MHWCYNMDSHNNAGDRNWRNGKKVSAVAESSDFPGMDNRKDIGCVKNLMAPKSALIFIWYRWQACAKFAGTDELAWIA